MSKEEFLAQDPEELEDFLRGYDFHPELDAASVREQVESGAITLEMLLEALHDGNAELFSTDVRGAEIWRSDDSGASWRRTHDAPLREVTYTYGYYFGQVRVAPSDPERIYVLGVPLLRSDDGGKSFVNVNAPTLHVDHQAMWIDPKDPGHVLLGNDGGLAMSFDGGETWLKLNPIAVGQIYALALDGASPYNVYAGLQDNGVLRGSSLSEPNEPPPWRRIGGGDGMYIAVDPRDDKTVYTGYQFGHYVRRNASGGVSTVRPRNRLGEPALRYNWQTPVRLSSHNPDIVYFGANRLFRSMDRGETWTALSEDLSRAPERGNVPFGTITTFSESTLDFGLIWVGTDDGEVWLTPDGGKSWRDVDAALPKARWVSRVEASASVRERVYVALNGYRDDDDSAYLYRSDDLGKTWASIAAGLPAEAVNVVREDPVNPDVVYVGTDRGAYVSLDQGAHWHALGAGLPNVPVHDIAVHPRERELVAGTHGRSAWVLDVLPVQELSEAVRASSLHLFPFDAIDAQRAWRSRRSLWWEHAGDPPEFRLSFWSDAAGRCRLRVLDEHGTALRVLEFEAGRGVGTLSWDLLLDPALALPAEEAARALAAQKESADESGDDSGETRAATPWAEAVRLARPLYVTAGTYTLELTRGDEETTATLTVNAPAAREPRVKPEPKIRGRR